MDSFYWIVLSIATLFLIVALAYVGWVMGQTKKAYKFPLFTTTCPDNWASTKIGETVVCKRPASNIQTVNGVANTETAVNRGKAELDGYLTNASSYGYFASPQNDNNKYMNPNDPKWAKK